MPEHGACSRVIVRDVIIAFCTSGVAPFIAGFFFMAPPASVFALISATIVLEYGAVFIGNALDMDNVLILITVSLVAAGIIFFQLSLFDHIGKSSHRVAAFLERIRRKYGSSPYIQKYGVFSLVPGMIVLGFFVCPAVAWILGWDRKTAFIVMTGTFCLASIVLLPVSEGFIQWISSLVGSLHSYY
jgi:hypothetical protein